MLADFWTRVFPGVLFLPFAWLYTAVVDCPLFHGASLRQFTAIADRPLFYEASLRQFKQLIDAFLAGGVPWKDLRRKLRFAHRYLRGCYLHSRFVQNTKNFRKIQDDLAHEFVCANADSQYSKQINLKGDVIHTVEQLAARHNIVTYDWYKDWLDRMAHGEQNVLASRKLHCFALTSGTTGKSKMIPVSERTITDFVDVINYTTFYHSVQVSNKLLEGRHVLRFVNPVARQMTESGLQAGAVSGFIKGFEPCTEDTTTPVIPLDQVKDGDITYIHLLFGLKDRRVVMIESSFASFLYANLSALEKLWPQLVTDIETGTVNPNLKIPEPTRKAIHRHLTPDSGRAKELRTAFQEGFTGIVKRIWPEVQLAYAATSGSFQLYVNILTSGYLKGIPIYSSFYGASESCFAMNCFGPEEGEPRYVLWPEAAVFEFIPFEVAGTPEQFAILPEKSEIGKEYELVITNSSGLYRYAMGDVITVVGFFNQTPIIQFAYRRGQLLSIRGEKTSEAAIYTSLSAACKENDVTLTDYTCAESGCLQEQARSGPPHYVIFMEVGQLGLRTNVVESFQKSVDDKLRSTAPRYDFYRQNGALGPVQLYLVKHDAFLRLRQFRLATTQGSANQLKAARLLVSVDQIRFMLGEIDV